MNFQEYYMLNEMPYGEILGKNIDFNLEKSYWNEKLLQLVKVTSKDHLEELLKPFYELNYKKILYKRSQELDSKSKQELLDVLPDKFKADMNLI